MSIFIDAVPFDAVCCYKRTHSSIGGCDDASRRGVGAQPPRGALPRSPRAPLAPVCRAAMLCSSATLDFEVWRWLGHTVLVRVVL